MNIVQTIFLVPKTRRLLRGEAEPQNLSVEFKKIKLTDDFIDEL